MQPMYSLCLPSHHPDVKVLLNCVHYTTRMLLFVVMAKQIPKGSGTKSNPKNEVAAGAPMIKGVVWGGIKPTSAVTAKGQSATGLAKGGPSIPSMSGKGSKGAFAGSGASVAQGFALSQPTKPSNIVKAALGAAGVAAAGASITRLGVKTVVSEGTKRLQRELQSELKTRSGKGMTKAQRQSKGESLDDLTPSERAEYVGQIRDMQKKMSESMKTTSKKKIVIKK